MYFDLGVNLAVVWVSPKPKQQPNCFQPNFTGLLATSVRVSWFAAAHSADPCTSQMTSGISASARSNGIDKVRAAERMDGKVRAPYEQGLRLRYRLVIMNRRWIQQAKAHRNDPEWLYEQLKGLDLALNRISNYFYGEALERLHPEIDRWLRRWATNTTRNGAAPGGVPTVSLIAPRHSSGASTPGWWVGPKPAACATCLGRNESSVCCR
jgi:hypothetical protein